MDVFECTYVSTEEKFKIAIAMYSDSCLFFRTNLKLKLLEFQTLKFNIGYLIIQLATVAV